MKQPQCIANGAEFFSPLEGRFVHGDLYAVGSAYVFNCCTDGQGNAAWQYAKPGAGDMVCSAEGAAYFERRGVIVFSAEVAVFNDRLSDYIRPAFERLRIPGFGI